ncbi:DUF4865 family protein [Dyella caseinilytica]|uniref:DUF4865 family protein n=1 Tax=Dyella caseinilytica TaxID=1849581 RepID=A0ABX7GUD1_9GAMM|nr:DUF4865 family protein [Dyella caseinilytica]QRN54032.1 DUF4865 family protein [Dyella caseinilytica]GFZ91095.1 DUF4865 domain-containing protein [Dyella caseinilytica]
MITMQYRIGLPADYDMDIIRHRIAERGHLTDDFPHLAFKTYLYADRTSTYAAGGENLYAPFYLWHNHEGMNAFLAGPGFAGVVESFGRPVVRTWSVWRAETASDLSAAQYATREIAPISAQAVLAALRSEEEAKVQHDVERGALAAISAFDPTSWTLMRFRLWQHIVDRPQGHDADVYAIGHISQPSSAH